MPGGGFSRSTTARSDSALPTDQPYILGDFCIDEYRPIKVIVIGAGYSGIIAGVRFPQKIPNVELVIYEKSAGVGGTWFNNNYPGLACDVPAHCYQLSFEDKNDWSSFYATGPEILAHLEQTVEKYKLMRYIKLRHEVLQAKYNSAAGKWHVRVRRPNPVTGAPEEVDDVADVLLSATGGLSRWKWPDIAGLHDFKGELHHSAGFDPQDKTWQSFVEGWADKKVGVVGVGSSAIQIVAALQPCVKRLVQYVRGNTWVALPFGSELLEKVLGREAERGDEFKFSEQELERFKNDSQFAQEFRLLLENNMNSAHAFTLRGTPLQLSFQKEECRENMEQKLAKKPWIAKTLIPEFPVSCRRLTPGPGYLEALVADNVDFVSSPIKQVTEKGLETVDGKYQDLDVIFPVEIIGRDGADLREKWTPHPQTYLAIAVDGFPNLFMTFGPNAAIASGCLLPFLESQVEYVIKATAKLQRERLKSMEPKAEATADFDQYIEAYFPKTVFSTNCRSWYKVGKADGRVVGLWPGSMLHALKTYMHPRWEDYNYELSDPGVSNRFYWLGDGQTYSEKTLSGDRAWYLRPPFLDIPPGEPLSDVVNVPTLGADSPLYQFPLISFAEIVVA
ncbi:FAD/NAD-P-binding domain-containing protein [Trametes elegans]|nr:FAD/NAD-P-binding domain-containing protein [Trametes elegans]